MDMAIDSAGQDQEARSVDFGSGARQILGKGDYAAAFYAHVAFADIGRRDDRSATNDKIKLHVPLPPISSGPTQDSCNLRQGPSGVAK